MMRRILNIILLLLVAGPAFGVGAPDFLPDGPHPRIWLTDTVLADLNAKQAANDPEWVELETWCDANLNTPGYNVGDIGWEGWRGRGYWTYLIRYALAYQILKDDNPTKADSYATYAKDILVNGITSMRAGENAEGLTVLRTGDSETNVTINSAEATAAGAGYSAYKIGYTARFLVCVPVAYDWLHDRMTPTERARIQAVMYRYYDWIRGVRSAYNDGVLINGVRYYEDIDGTCNGTTDICPSSALGTKAFSYGGAAENFFGGEFAMMSLIPIVTYGDTPDADGYLTHLKTDLWPTMRDPLLSNLQYLGGDSTEGWSYGSAFHFSLPSMLAMAQATGESLPSDLPLNVLKFYLHAHEPNLPNIGMYGVWKGVPMTARKGFLIPFLHVNRVVNPSALEVGYGDWFVENAGYTDDVDLWQSLLWKPIVSTPISPDSMPVFYHAQGTGYVISRSGWDSNAVFSTIRLEGKTSSGYDGYDEGTILLTRGRDRLLTHQNTFSASASVANTTLVFNNTSHQSSNPALTNPAIDRIENGIGYMYVSGDITNAWKRQYKVDGAKLFRRSFLHLRPGVFVVYDVAQSNSAIGNLKEWYTQYEADPTTAADTITVTKGSSKAFIKALYPTGGTFTETNPSAGYWRVKYTPATQQEYDQFLHVIEATGSADSQTPTSLINGTGGRGALIGGTTVAMFTKDQNGADITSLTYSADTSGPSTHYIADLTPGATYNVSIDGGAATPYVASDAGLIVFENPVFSPHTYTITLDSLPTTETSCTDGVDNDGDGQTDCADSDCSADQACADPPADPTCSDGIQNQGETGVDCGGPCAACQTPTTGRARLGTVGSPGVRPLRISAPGPGVGTMRLQ